MRSAFTRARRARVVELLGAGASRAEAARGAGVHPSTVCRWIKRGRTAHPEGQFHAFYRDVMAAESDRRLVVLQSTSTAMDPDVAWTFLVGREPGFAVPEADFHAIPELIELQPEPRRTSR